MTTYTLEHTHTQSELVRGPHTWGHTGTPGALSFEWTVADPGLEPCSSHQFFLNLIFGLTSGHNLVFLVCISLLKYSLFNLESYIIAVH